MEHELITLEEIADLPDDPHAAFVEFEKICRHRLREAISTLDHNESGSDFYLEYMSRVRAAAVEFEIEFSESLSIPRPSQFEYSDYRSFSQLVVQAVTHIQIKRVRREKLASVELAPADKLKIEHHIDLLRARINESDLDDGKRKSLNKRLDALLAELKGKRLDFARVMVVIASAATAINQSEAAIIKLPEAINAVIEVIGLAKREEGDRLPAPPPQKAIEDKRQPPSARAVEDQSKAKLEHTSFSADLDDEIPF